MKILLSCQLTPLSMLYSLSGLAVKVTLVDVLDSSVGAVGDVELVALDMVGVASLVILPLPVVAWAVAVTVMVFAISASVSV